MTQRDMSTYSAGASSASSRGSELDDVTPVSREPTEALHVYCHETLVVLHSVTELFQPDAFGCVWTCKHFYHPRD
jgi:hypothetical protein